METKEAAEEDDVDDGDDDGEIRVSDDVIVRNEIDDDDEVIEGDLKTMKEIIEMELQNKSRNLMDAASVFTQKLRKWRQKQKEKKQSRCISGGIDIDRSKLGQTSQFRDSQSEVADYGLGRRSCDTEPRFSIDAVHRLSVEEPRFSFDEHRASWDGYMMARTIPRLTPMLSVVDNMMLGSVNRVTNTAIENLHSISEDGASSGGSAQSNSDSTNSNIGSSSSSMKSSSRKTEGFGGDDVKSASNARVSPAMKESEVAEAREIVVCQSAEETKKQKRDAVGGSGWSGDAILHNKLENRPHLRDRLRDAAGWQLYSYMHYEAKNLY
ncbi:hypothetical protein L1987_04155 [Smallanthus sonchifolius]|uniref:Uncharacterized protein n=1 Tax=Smallanthus sonchifolius TaxID=185202 RepID=A0ACB9KCR3_9ASTR|nr:hypothetical protein L1987_04155 [Smallanthus sonchifolius]